MDLTKQNVLFKISHFIGAGSGGGSKGGTWIAL